MKNNIIAASIIAVGLIVAGFLSGGRYSAVHTRGDQFLLLDRWTGNVNGCDVQGEGCAWYVEHG